jgi:hypothetical protein
LRPLLLVRRLAFAQIYEAGAADTAFGSQPFFAMEIIHGKRLLDYADAAKLNPRQRLPYLYPDLRLDMAVRYVGQFPVIPVVNRADLRNSKASLPRTPSSPATAATPASPINQSAQSRNPTVRRFKEFLSFQQFCKTKKKGRPTGGHLLHNLETSNRLVLRLSTVPDKHASHHSGSLANSSPT